MTTQAATGRCDRGHATTIRATSSPYEFTWTCPMCPSAGVISWAHVNPAPAYDIDTPQQQIGLDL